MAYILEGKPLSPDSSFTHNGIQYPAGWIRRASEESRQAIGLFWQADPPRHDQRFWWGYGVDGELIPKDLDQLKENWTSSVKQLAGQLLSASDWVIIRTADPSSTSEPSPELLAERALIREKSNDKEQAISECASVAELAAYITGSEFHAWIEQPPVEEPEQMPASEDPIITSDDVDPEDDPILDFSNSMTGGSIADSGTDSVSFDD